MWVGAGGNNTHILKIVREYLSNVVLMRKEQNPLYSII
jgi:hypothetical protein